MSRPLLTLAVAGVAVSTAMGGLAVLASLAGRWTPGPLEEPIQRFTELNVGLAATATVSIGVLVVVANRDLRRRTRVPRPAACLDVHFEEGEPS